MFVAEYVHAQRPHDTTWKPLLQEESRVAAEAAANKLRSSTPGIVVRVRPETDTERLERENTPSSRDPETCPHSETRPVKLAGGTVAVFRSCDSCAARLPA